MHVIIWDSQDKWTYFSWKQTSTTHALWWTEYDTLRSFSLSPVYWSSIISSSLLRREKKLEIISSLLTTIIRLLFLLSYVFVQTRICGFYFPVTLSISLSFHLSDDIDELFFFFDQFRECLWCQTKWHGSTFECISSVSLLRIQVVTSSELWDWRLHEIKWSTGCRQRLSSFIVGGVQALATSTMIKRGQSFDQWWTLE